MTAVVIPFRRKPEPPKPTGWMLTALIDSNANLEADDLFACYLSDPNQVMFWKWYGPTGRDTNGRFCKRADSRGKIATDHIGFSMQDVQDGYFHVLGKVVWVLGPAMPCDPSATEQ